MQDGIFAKDLGSAVKPTYSIYNSGTDETTAILAGALDAAFVGPNPAINAYQKSDGSLIRVVAGMASGGAFLVVKPSITTAAELKGKKLATPSLGNTQDVALRTWLKSKGLSTTLTGGGDVSIVPQDNSTTVTAFQSGAIDGAWVPEPYATKLEGEGGKVLVNEASLWPQGKFVTTQLVVTTKFLTAHPDVVANLVKGLADSIDVIHNDKTKAEQLVSDGIDKLTGKAFAVSLVDKTFANITFTLDPIKSSLLQGRRERQGARAHQVDRPHQPLRPDAAEQAAPAARRADDRAMKHAPTNETNVRYASAPVDPTGAGASARPVVSIEHVTKAFGTGRQRLIALDGVTLDVEPGEFVCLLGASGCGKSTLLNLVAGLDQPTSGRLDVAAKRVGLMFQEAALFPWLTVRGNVEIALKLAGVPRRAAPAARARAARHGASRRLRQAPAPRALGRDAPANRARAGARAGCRSAPHGRALRRARRDDARQPARRARGALDRHRQDGDVRDAQRARGRAARRLRRVDGEQARTHRRRLQRHDSPPPAYRLARSGNTRRDDHRPTTRGGRPWPSQLTSSSRLPRSHPPAAARVAHALTIWNAVWPKLLAITIVILGWQLVVWLHLYKAYLVPSPFTVLDRLFHEPGTMVTASVVTLRRGAQGFFLAMLIGGVVGMAVARVPILRAAIGSMITGLQTMPSVAWVPLAIILFREGQGTVTFVVVLGAAPSIANGIINGIDHVPPILLRAGRVLGARGFGALRHVVIPAALPAVVGGLKQGWAFAWRSLMAAELIGGLGGHLGIGQLLNNSAALADYTGVFEAMIVILVIGILIDACVFGIAERAIRKRYGLIDASAA